MGLAFSQQAAGTKSQQAGEADAAGIDGHAGGSTAHIGKGVVDVDQLHAEGVLPATRPRRPLFYEDKGGLDAADVGQEGGEEETGEGTGREWAGDGGGDVEGLDMGPVEAFERRYPAHGRGLVERLMALEDAGYRCAEGVAMLL